MKALIWIGCIFCLSLCFVMIKNAGFILGGIPSAFMFGGMWWIASSLSKKWDTRKQKKNEEDNVDSNENK